MPMGYFDNSLRFQPVFSQAAALQDCLLWESVGKRVEQRAAHLCPTTSPLSPSLPHLVKCSTRQIRLCEVGQRGRGDTDSTQFPPPHTHTCTPLRHPISGYLSLNWPYLCLSNLSSHLSVSNYLSISFLSEHTQGRNGQEPPQILFNQPHNLVAGWAAH